MLFFQEVGAVYFEMAGRPAPLLEVQPQVGLERQGGIGFELVLSTAVPQQGVELDVKRLLEAKLLSDWLEGKLTRADLEGVEEAKEKEKVMNRKVTVQETPVVQGGAPSRVAIPQGRNSERVGGKVPRVIPPRRISERIKMQIDDVPGQGSPQTRTSERIQEQTVFPGLQSIPQKRTSKRIVEQNADVSEPQVIPQKRISKRTAEQNAEDSVPQVIPQKRISERIVEQNVDEFMQIIPQERTSERIQGHVHEGDSTSSSAAVSLDTAEWLGIGVFALFPRPKKVRRPPRSRVRTCCRTRAHGRRRLMSRVSRPRGRSSTSCTNAIRGGAGGTRSVSSSPGGWLIRGFLFLPDYWVPPWELDFGRRDGGGG